MTTRLRFYLAGPIRGCSDEQKTWWRDEAKQLLKRDFDFEDPTEWADDRVLSLEIPKLEACDILLANMWKESIGTTLGIVRARHQGKPVVLADPNRIHNAILLRLVGVDNHFHSLDEACGNCPMGVLGGELLMQTGRLTMASSNGRKVQAIQCAGAGLSVVLAPDSLGSEDALRVLRVNCQLEML